MLKKYIITLIVGAVLSALSYATDNGGLPIPQLFDLTNTEAEESAVVEVPLLAVVQPPAPDDKNIVAVGPDLIGGGAYMHCPQKQVYNKRRCCQARWTCRGPLRRIVFWPLRRLLGRRC